MESPLTWWADSSRSSPRNASAWATRPLAVLGGYTTAGECAACGKRFSNDGVAGAAGAAKIDSAFSRHVFEQHFSEQSAGPTTSQPASAQQKSVAHYVTYAVAVVAVL